MNKKNVAKIAIFLILLTCLIGAVNASEDVSTDTINTADDQTTPQETTHEDTNKETVSEPTQKVSDDTPKETNKKETQTKLKTTNTETTNNTNNNEKTTTTPKKDNTLKAQNNQEPLKGGTKEVTVNNWDELKTQINNAITDTENDTYIINLAAGTYKNTKVNERFNAGLTQPNIIINGNGQTLDGTTKRIHINGFNITINNLILKLQINSTSTTTLNNVYLDGSTFTNNKELNLINSTLKAQITNNGILTIDENTTGEGTKCKIIGDGKFYINNPDLIPVLESNYVFINDKTLNETAKDVYNYGHMIIENATITKAIYNYGELEIVNSITSGANARIWNYKNLTFINSTLKQSTTQTSGNYGNLTFSSNSTINGPITNTGNLNIDDNTNFGSGFILKNNGGTISYKDINELLPYMQFNDGETYTFENININLAGKTNSGILYFINCTLTGYYLTNTGEVFIINSTSSATIINTGIVNVENSTLGGKIQVSQDQTGTLNIGNNVTFNPKFQIDNVGDVITNKPDEIFFYLTNINGNHNLNNVNITTPKTINGDLTLINSTISAEIKNKGTLTIINSTISEFIGNYLSSKLVIINSTINRSFGCVGDYTNPTITVSNSTFGTNAGRVTNKGTLTITNTTNIPFISNFNKLIMPLDENKEDNEIFSPTFQIGETGTVKTNDMNRLFKYMIRFYGTATIELGNYNQTITNYGTLTIENSTLTKTITNSEDSTLVLKNSTISERITNRGTLELKNATINAEIYNSGTLIISDDTIFGENFKITGFGNIVINDTQRLVDFVSTYIGDTVLNNKTINTTVGNRGNLTLTNCTINSTVSNTGRLIISDDTIFGENAKIIGNGEIVISDITRLLPYTSTINGNYVISNTNLTKTYTFFGTVTINNCNITSTDNINYATLNLNNCNITSTDNINYATLNLNNCSVNVGEDNTFLTNLRTVHVSKDTVIVGKIKDFANGVIYETEPQDEPQTYIITQESIQYFLDSNGLNLVIKPGDTLDIQGKIILNHSLLINKPVNIISSTKDGYIDLNTTAGDYFGSSQGNTFSITNAGSHTNITGIYFHNTQLWLYNTHYVTLDNISVVVENRRVGSGVGITSIRENSTHITVKNSYFHTTENEGSSTLVLALADYCTIENNTIEGDGFIGNLLYLTTYNVKKVPNGMYNSHNTIINNRLRGPEIPTSTCYGICISGFYNLVENNTITYDNGYGIMFQWGSGITNIETPGNESLVGRAGNIVCNNKLYGGCGITAGDLIYNNYMEGKLSVPSNSKAYNNTANRLEVYANSEVTNNTILGRVTFAADAKYSIVANNTINGNIEIPTKAVNITIKDNNITGTITLDGSFVNITNNKIISNDEYAITSTKLGQNNIISDNYIVSQDKCGDASVDLRDGSNIIQNNNPLGTTIELAGPSETIVNKAITIAIKLVDNDGNLIKDAQVLISSNNGNETVTLTDGTYNYTYTPKTIGEDTITVKYNGNQTLFKSKNSAKVNVIAEPEQPAPEQPAPEKQTTPAKTTSKVSLTLTKAIPKTISKKAKKLVISTKVKVGTKVAKKKKVTFIIKGKKYTRKTTKKGIAKLTLTKKQLAKILRKVKTGKKIKVQIKYGKKTITKYIKVKK